MVKVTVDAGVQFASAKSKRPCGKPTAGAEPLGGLERSPSSAMKRLAVKVHVNPPPVKSAVIVPLPVAEGAVYGRTTAVGVTLAAAEGGPAPAALLAVTEQL